VAGARFPLRETKGINTAQSDVKAMLKVRCQKCGNTKEGDRAPVKCGICGAWQYLLPF